MSERKGNKEGPSVRRLVTTITLADRELWARFKEYCGAVGRSAAEELAALISERLGEAGQTGVDYNFVARQVETKEGEWRRARAGIVHADLLGDLYVKCGGTKQDFGNYLLVLGRMKSELSSVATTGKPCPAKACGELVDKGHLDGEWHKFSRYLSLRLKHQELRQRADEVQEAQFAAALQADVRD